MILRQLLTKSNIPGGFEPTRTMQRQLRPDVLTINGLGYLSTNMMKLLRAKYTI